MIANQKLFPHRLTLWRGAILGTIAHAISITPDPDFSHEQSWDGPNYSIQDSMGSQGTISFVENQVVGVFFDKDSPRNPFRSGSYDLRQRLAEMPTTILSIANNEALQYVLQEYQGTIMPIITSVFWSEGEYLSAAEPWIEVFNHGAHLIKIQLQDTEAALNEWRTEYELTLPQIDLVRSLFERKLTTPNDQILLSDQEYDLLTANGDEGLEDSKELLKAVGIILP